MNSYAIRRQRVWRSAAIGCAGLVVACLSLLTFARPAPADEIQTFFFSGGEQGYVVPAGVHMLHVVAAGARGGKGSDDVNAPTFGGSGGFGSRVEADLAVTPGEVLFVEVGGPGSSGLHGGGGGGGFNGGGESINNPAAFQGGGGGGATDLRTCSIAVAACSTAPNSLSSRILVAGGGGGGGALARLQQPTGGEGGDGGENGHIGQTQGCGSFTPAGGGGAGTQSAGGAGGSAGSGGASPGNPGSFGQGGAAGTGGSQGVYGGGGGGGYFGGGAGGNANGCTPAGGGGGSSFSGPGTSNVQVGTDMGAARVVITSRTPSSEPPPGSGPGPTGTPGSDFSFGALTRNKRVGTAQLAVVVPGPGSVALSGQGLLPQLATQSLSTVGEVRLNVRATGKARRRLTRTGRVNATATVTYTPSGAEAISKPLEIRLVKRRP